MEIERYTSSSKRIWDDFVRRSKNGTFLFFRDYMDYHSDRFTDHSLVFYEKGRIVAVFPANLAGSDLHSHQGLTYGGLVLGYDSGSTDVLRMFDAMKEYCKSEGFSAIHYKQIPTIYHKAPSLEDEYALWRNGAEIESCNIASAVRLDCLETTPCPSNRRYYRNHLLKNDLYISFDTPLEEYWPCLEAHLRQRYGTGPVHTLQEMRLLQERFPDSIKCIAVRNSGGSVCGGTIAYLQDKVFHLQYSCSSDEGMKTRAIVFLYQYLLEYCRKNGYEYFDMGTSNERQGLVLNESLDFFKWSVGGRGISCKTYCLKI